MNKGFRYLLVLMLTLQVQARADEGMWLLNLLEQLNMEEMSALGLELTAEQIYSINNVSLKDAIGALDGGSCTAELVSAEGLLLTNHHCGYEEIQYHSSLENDYLKNGFWAMTREEELPNEGKTISFLVSMEDVTEKVLEDISDDLPESARRAKIREVSRELENQATEGNHYDANVESMLYGNRFFLFVMETYLDVRLVGAPPESIGKFGSDTDNWVWPRHTGDFSMFRVYTGPDGLPAEYSPENIPLKSKHFLPISMKGYEKGDFTMVLGFPGGTDRYITSFEVEELLSIEHPVRIKVRGVKQELMMEDMMADEKVRIQYANKYYGESTNYWKYSIGQSEGLRNLNVVANRQNEEELFRAWVNEDSDRQETYGEALRFIEDAIEGRAEYQFAAQYLFECIYFGMESVIEAGNFMRLNGLLKSPDPDPEEVAFLVGLMREDAAEFFKDYNMPTDRKVMTAMLGLLLEDIPTNHQPDFVAGINSEYKGKVDKYVDKYFKKSIFTDEAKMLEFLDNPSVKTLDKDPALLAYVSFLTKFREMMGSSTEYDQNYNIGSRLYLRGRQEMDTARSFYPDANSTMRLSYGTVGDYKPRDGVYYDYYTTLKGVMEKEDPDNYEFYVEDRLKELYKASDYGPYGENGLLNVCFTSNNDITGGNSGSPVINGKGELTGIAFDGNWEAMSGDVEFETELQKCINVDIRYVLFVIDKYAGAGHLVEEMKLVN